MNCPHCGHKLTKRQIKRIWSYYTASLRRKRGTGNPKKLKRCPKCGALHSAREMARCPVPALSRSFTGLRLERAEKAFRMRLNGATYEEIAREVGMSPNGARGLIARYMRWKEKSGQL